MLRVGYGLGLGYHGGESRRRAVHVQEHKHGAMVRFIVVVVSNYFTGHGTPIASC